MQNVLNSAEFLVGCEFSICFYTFLAVRYFSIYIQIYLTASHVIHKTKKRFTNLCQICARTILQGETLQTSQQITLDGAPSIGINQPLSASSRTKQTLKRLNFELENPSYEGL